MKKVTYIASLILTAAFFASCGPSEATQKAEEDKLRMEADSTKNSIKEDIASQMDSLKKDNSKTSDSLVKVEKK